MRTFRSNFTKGAACLVMTLFILAPSLATASKGESWHFNGTAIEACSCPMFCQCYFNTHPALHKTDHGVGHFCKFNMAYMINKGFHGDTDLSGVKFWIGGDLGETWEDGEADWAVLTFQIGTTEEQKAGVAAALGHIFPLKWKSFVIAEDADIEWSADEAGAEAKLAGGSDAHIILNKWEGIDGKTGMLTNIAYMGAPRNTGFKMMPNKIETWKKGDQAFEFKGTTGFMITIDMSSDDVAATEKQVM